MPINSRHRQYEARAPEWQDCRDAMDWRKVKKAGSRYLPKLSSDQESDEYDDYKRRAYFLEAFPRTIAALVGAVTQKPAAQEQSVANLRFEEWLTDVTGEGDDIDSFAADTLDEVLEVTRQGIYVTMQAEASAKAIPHLQRYTAEQIINWNVISSTGEPLWMVLEEVIEVPKADDPYVMEEVTQWRELTIFHRDEERGTVVGQFTVNIWRERKPEDVTPDTDRFYIHETIVPLMAGKPLNFIPFVFCNGTHLGATPERPVYAGLVEAIYDHYRLMADWRHGLSITGLPTPYFFGEGAATAKLYIGSRSAWTSDDPQAKAGMIEYTGQGLGALEEAVSKQENTIAYLGARLLATPRQQVEATETHRIRQQAEQVSIVGLAATVSEAITKAVGYAILWAQLALEYSYSLNTDVTNTRLDAQELTALIASFQTGAISWDTLYYNLEQGEIARPGVSAEDEKALLEIAAPVGVEE